ncbi:hypothetical protein TNCV_104701 [Trichonephila clavipes]|nr:hypothetical protein TNCV_104701 [Trichonephila clavipes]
MRSTKDQLVEKRRSMPVKNNVFLWNLPDVEEILIWSPWKYRQDSVRSEWPLWHAAKIKNTVCAQGSTRTETNFEQKQNFWTLEQKEQREKGERERCARAGVTF